MNFRSDDYKNLYHLVTHEERRDSNDVTTKFIFAGVLLSCLKAIGYFDGIKREEGGKASKEEILIGQFHRHLREIDCSSAIVGGPAAGAESRGKSIHWTRMWPQKVLHSGCCSWQHNY